MGKGNGRRPLPLLAINALIALSLIIASSAAAALAACALSLPGSISIEGPAIGSSGGSMGVHAKAKITNSGPLPMAGISINATVSSTGMPLLNAAVPPVDIPSGASREIPLDLTFGMGAIPQPELLRLMTSNDTITLSASFRGGFSPLLGVSANLEASIPWLAPISNLRVATANFTQIDESTASALLLVSFDNLSDFLPVVGRINATVADPFGGAYNISFLLDVEPKSSFEGAFPITITPPSVSLIDLFFSSATNLTFTVNASVEVQGLGVVSFTRASDIGWGGYMSDVEFGIPIILPVNLSHSHVTFPFTFVNSNDMPLRANMTAILTYANTTLSASAATQISAPPHQRCSSQLSMVLPNLFFLLKGAFLTIHVQTDFGEFNVGVPINA